MKKNKKKILLSIFIILIIILGCYINIRWTERVATEKTVNAVLNSKGFEKNIKSETTMYDTVQDRFIIYVAYNDVKEDSIYAVFEDSVYSFGGNDKYEIA